MKNTKLLELYQNTLPVTTKNGYFKHVTPSFLQWVIELKFLLKQKNIIVVTPNLYDAQKFYDKLSNCIGEEFVLFYPQDQILTTIMALGSPEFKNERLFTLRKLLEGKENYVVITTQDGLLKRQLKPQDYINSVLTLKKGMQYRYEKLTQKLIYDGYKYNYTVERPGEYSIRGSIVDIFTHHNKNPYRIDFFDDEIETIKTFDVLTQRSIESVEEIEIAPLHELFFTDKQKDEVLEKIKDFFGNKELSTKENDKYLRDLENLEQRNKLDTLSYYIPFFNEEETTILNFTNHYELIFVDYYKMVVNENNVISDLKILEETLKGNAFTLIPFRLPLSSLDDKDKIKFDLYHTPNIEAIELSVFDIESFENLLDPLIFHLKNYETFKVFFILKNQENLDKIKKFIELNKKDISNECYFILDEFPGSFIDENNKVIIITDEILFKEKKTSRIRYRSVINQSVKVRDASELTEGDYVVHYNFGIGRYMGLKTMDLSGVKRDYLHIIYDNDEALYVPTDQIDLILKYRNFDDIPPKLSKLGTKQWQKTKEAVKKKIKDLSDRLLKLYSQRKEAKGYKFSEDNEILKEFEGDFKYEETKDQLKAIESVKRDMESEIPMDRLIAGDVGFGKTEIALRASFKAILDGKQVAYLVPTTILARQHYLTFKERFEKYGGVVELLSRFVSKKDQNQILERLKNGYIDVLIGTHRILSDDVVFKDLGLFIIDEEQRFGVEHKEKIKELKVNVDTLTLSATPIPRTLQMAMYGLKDLSMIETPPLNRYPVQTYVIERQDPIIKEAIEKEIARGGQVFYLFNNVIGIEHVVEHIKELVPYARVSFAHGKMRKDQLEKVLESFINRDFDVLVATTIIETGVDIPNSNTLIIHDADKLGLAQLYQLRGRVGRSDRIAYAYLMYDAHKNMNDEARKRLSVIEDFTDLGSGLKIALRDLNIRGAGDILGEEQSGFIDSVGMEVYLRLLKEVMEPDKEVETQTEGPEQIFAQRHIPKEYIEKDSVRIEIHKRIQSLNRLSEVHQLKDELTDRFGHLDLDVSLYMYEKLYKKLCHKASIKQTIVEKNIVKMVIPWGENVKLNGIKFYEAALVNGLTIELKDMRGQTEVHLLTKLRSEHWLYLACELLDYYVYAEDKQRG